jgi:hypothetical protein
MALKCQILPEDPPGKIFERANIGIVESPARKVNEPLAAIALNAEASLRWLAHPKPDVREAIDALRAILREVERAGGMIQEIHVNCTSHVLRR